MTNVRKSAEPDKHAITFGGRDKLISELKDSSAKALVAMARAGYYQDYPFTAGNKNYLIPALAIPDLEVLLAEQEKINSKTSKSLQAQVDSKRHSVIFYRGLVIKSAKKGILYPFFDPQNEQKRQLRRERVALEFVNSHNLASVFDGHVVESIGVIESLRPEHKSGTGELYLVERYFEPLGNPEESEAKKAAYASFLESVGKQGYEYVPANDKAPYVDLVVRLKKNGSLNVLATDWPHFQKRRK